MDSAAPTTVNKTEKTEAEFIAQANEARSALTQFANVSNFKNPSPLLVKASMEEIMRATVRGGVHFTGLATNSRPIAPVQ